MKRTILTQTKVLPNGDQVTTTVKQRLLFGFIPFGKITSVATTYHSLGVSMSIDEFIQFTNSLNNKK